MDLILDFICRLSFSQLAFCAIALLGTLLWLPEAVNSILWKWQRFRELDEEAYQPWMDKEKWDETR